MLHRLPAFAFLALVVAPVTKGDDPPANRDPKPAASDDSKQQAVRISKETTRLTEPLDEEGYLDYVEAVRLKYSKGVTPENNFEVVVRRVMGPKEIGDNAEEYHRQLGIDVLPADGNYYRNTHEFLGYPKLTETQRRAYDAEYDIVLEGPWRSTDHPRTARWLKAMNGHIDAIAEGTRRPRNFVPYIAPPMDDEADGTPKMIAILLPSVQQQREICRALKIRAMNRLGEGDLDGAWSDLQAIHRQARLLDEGLTLIEGLVAIALDSIAFHGDALVLQAEPDAERTAKYLADLRELESIAQMADRIDEGERYMGLDAVQTFARHGVSKLDEFAGVAGGSSAWGQLVSGMLKNAAAKGGTAIDWNVTMTMLNETYDEMVAAGREPDYEKRTKMFQKIDEDLKKVSEEARNPTALIGKVLLSGEPRKAMGRMMGNVLASLLLPAVTQTRVAQDRAESSLVVTRLAFALRAHHLEHGRYPETLAALAPKYVPSVPADPMTGQPLKYERTKGGFVVYGLGQNREDDDGYGYSNRPEADRESDDIGVTFGER